MDYTPSIFGKNLRLLRKASKLTQQQLTDAAGVSCVARVESGQTQLPGVESIHALADALECPVADLWREGHTFDGDGVSCVRCGKGRAHYLHDKADTAAEPPPDGPSAEPAGRVI